MSISSLTRHTTRTGGAVRRRLAALTVAFGILAGAAGPAGALDLAGDQPPEPPQLRNVIDELIGPLAPIPRSGWGDTRLGPVLDALSDFMQHRCVGAATLGIAYRGVPLGEWGFGRTNGRASSSILDPECGDGTLDPYDPSASNIDHRTPMMLGSISKPITAATLRWVLKNTYAELTGEPLSDAHLESLRIFGDDFPMPLVPQELRDLYNGVTPLPSELVLDPCVVDGEEVVDPRWSEITVGQLLAHRAGLPGSAPDYETQIVPRLAFLRGHQSAGDFLLAHNHLRELAPDPVAFDAGQALLQGSGDPLLFVETATLEEILMVVAGRCLAFEPGTHEYSNTSPAFWQVIINHLDPSGRYVSAIGDLESHTGSALQRFVADELSLNSFGNKGIFRVLGETGVDQSIRMVPQQRNWNATQQTYVPLTLDDKRIHCILVGNTCDTNPWRTGDRAHWTYGTGEVPFNQAYGMRSPGTGSLVAEPRYMLRYMSRFWIGGYGHEPRIGAPRNDVWTIGTSHRGSLPGGRAYAWQSGGGTTNYTIPAVDGSGRIADAFAHLHPGSGSIPAGVDVFVAVNQRTDPKCQASQAAAAAHAATPGGRDVIIGRPPATYTCGEAYDLLEHFVKYGLTQVDWDGIVADLEARGPAVVIPVGPSVITSQPDRRGR
jgi:CubicO group peptidase (beta-lactamase class C family)